MKPENKTMSIDSINMLLCQEVQKYPVLYDWKTYGFNNKVPETKAWAEIARKLNRSTYECKDKWKQMRCSYGKNLQNISKRARTPPYYMTPFLKFLDPFITTRSQPRKKSDVQKKSTIKIENMEAVDEEVEKIVNQSPQNWTWQLDAPTVCKVEDADPLLKVLDASVHRASDNRPTETYRQVESPDSGENKSKEETLTGQIDVKDPMDFLPNSADRDSVDGDTLDPDMAFFQSLMPDMRIMTNGQKRHFRIECMNLINEILTPSQ